MLEQDYIAEESREGRDHIPVISRLQVAGVNHQTAPVELREKLAIPKGAGRPLVEHLARSLGLKEIVALSTCNRTEFYWVAEEEIDPLAFFRSLPDARGEAVDGLASSIYRMGGVDAARHLFEVTCGLDSLVLGETQIFNQVKRAYQRSKELRSTGPCLNTLFQKAFEVTKKVHTQTGLNSGRASVPSVALELAEAIFEDLSQLYVLIIGTGEIAGLILDGMVKRGARRLGFVTRTAERAESLRKSGRGEVYTLEELDRVLWKADIVVSCTAANRPVVSPSQVKQALAERKKGGLPLLVLDLGLPRNVDPEVGHLGQVYLRNVDDLEKVVEKNRARLQKEVVKARKITDEAVLEYVDDCRVTTAVSTIRDIRARAREIGDMELSRTMNKLDHLSEKEKEEVATLVHRILGKILNEPTQSLRAASKNGDAGDAIAWARKLFGLGSSDPSCACEIVDEDTDPDQD